jgi:hypothetical protein
MSVDFSGTPKENTMRQLLIAATLVTAFVTPVLAAEFMVMYDNDAKKCVTMATMPSDMKKYKMLGKYPTQGEAETAMHTMTECK